MGKMLSLKLKAEHDKHTRPELDNSVSTFYYKYLGPYSQNTQSLKAEKLNFRIHVFRGVSPKSLRPAAVNVSNHNNIQEYIRPSSTTKPAKSDN